MSEKLSLIDIQKIQKSISEKYKTKNYVFKLFNINNKEVYRIYDSLYQKDEDFVFQSNDFNEIIEFINK